jgi:hypothetical protein
MHPGSDNPGNVPDNTDRMVSDVNNLPQDGECLETNHEALQASDYSGATTLDSSTISQQLRIFFVPLQIHVVERRPVYIIASVDVRAVTKQNLHTVFDPTHFKKNFGSQMQGCPFCVVSCVDLGSAGKQEPHEGWVIVTGCIMKRGLSFSIYTVDVGA